MAVTVAAGQSGATGVAIGSGATETITFAAAYPSAVEVTATGNAVAVRIDVGADAVTVPAGQTRVIDARVAPQPLRVRVTATAGPATVSVLGRDGDRYIADPTPAPPPPDRVSGALRVWNPTGIVPAAGANANGAPAVCLPNGGRTGLLVILLARVVYSGTFGAETVTVTFVGTFSDSTTASGTSTATATGTQTLGATGLAALSKDGLFLRQVTVTARSNIAASAVAVAVDLIALQV